MTKKRLFLYPGAHKTASSLLQAALEVNRPALEASGLSILRRQVFFKSGMKDMLRERGGADGVATADWDAMSERVLGPDWRNRDIVMSVENVFGEPDPPSYRKMRNCMDNLLALFPDHDIRVVYYIRRQDTFLESLYTQRIHRGYEEEPDAFLRHFDGMTLDWLAMLQPVFKRVGRKNVSFRCFESIKDGPQRYVARFFKDFSDLPRAELMKDFDQLTNTNLSLSDLGLRMARAAFSELPEMRERRQLTKLLQTGFGNDKYPRFRISDDLRQGIIERHREANERLVKRRAIPKALIPHYLFEDKPTEAEA